MPRQTKRVLVVRARSAYGASAALMAICGCGVVQSHDATPSVVTDAASSTDSTGVLDGGAGRDASITDAGTPIDASNVDAKDASRRAPTPFADAITAAMLHTCAHLINGEVKCWGDGAGVGNGAAARVGNAPGQMGSALPVVDLGTGRTAISVVAGLGKTCALLDDRTVKCWGDGWADNLGLGSDLSHGHAPNTMGDFLPALGLGRPVQQLGLGAACAILDNGDAKCWGHNERGQLGQGTSQPVPLLGMQPINFGGGRKATQIVAANANTCAILDSGELSCWGQGDKSVNGSEDTGTLGDDPSEVGDNFLRVNLGTGRTAKSVAVGSWHACAILDDGGVKCWGNNAEGQLGVGDTRTQAGGAPGEMGDNLPYVQLGTGLTVKKVAVEANMSCALFDNGRVKCWGHRLGVIGFAPVGRSAADMGDNLPYVDLGTGRTVRDIQLGIGHACALLDNGRIKCWGAGSYLGYGDTMDRGPNPADMGDNLPYVDLGP